MTLLLARADTPTLGPLIFGFVVGIGALWLGVARYRGWHKSSLLAFPFDSLHFAPAWWGAAIVLAMLGSLGSLVSPWFLIVSVLGVAPLLVGLLSLFWLPDRLLPAWYLDWRARGRPAWEVASKSDRKIARARDERRARKAIR